MRQRKFDEMVPFAIVALLLSAAIPLCQRQVRPPWPTGRVLRGVADETALLHPPIEEPSRGVVGHWPANRRCDGALSCGSCTTAQTCGGGGVVNVSGTAAENVIRYEDTYDGIHYFQTFDYKTSDVAKLASHAVYVWGSNQSISAYRSSNNPGIILSKYIPFTRDPDGTHNLAYWKSTHPDWVLYKCDKVTPAYEFGGSNVPLDISNPAVLAWQVQNYGAKASAAGYDAIAADNYVLTNVFGACGIYQKGSWRQLYTGTTDPKYTEDVLAWAGAFQARLHALPNPIGLIPNFILSDVGAWNDPRVLSLVAKVDGILDECSFSGCGQTISPQLWLTVQRLAEYTQSQGKAYFHINEVKSIDRPTIQFSLASYLMSKEHAAAIFISGSQQYGADLWRTEYGAPIGTPCDAMRATQGVYMRSFTHGLAIANPGTKTVTITLPAGSFKDIYGADVGSAVTLGPSRGIVLLDRGGPRC